MSQGGGAERERERQDCVNRLRGHGGIHVTHASLKTPDGDDTGGHSRYSRFPKTTSTGSDKNKRSKTRRNELLPFLLSIPVFQAGVSGISGGEKRQNMKAKEGERKPWRKRE